MIDLSATLYRLFHLHAALPRMLHRGGRAFRPLHMFVEVTYRCNLRCNFCEYLDIIERKANTVGPITRDLPADDLKRRIDEFPNGRLITFAGGETLVRKDFPELLSHASRRHRTHVISNGALIDEDVARRYVDLAPRWPWQSGMVLVGISLQGLERHHDRVVGRAGSWRQAVDGIGHLVRLRRRAGKSFPKLNLKMVVTRDTVDALVDFVYLGHELGVDVVNFMAEHDLVDHSAILTEHGDGSRIHSQQRKPEGVDPTYLREQLVRCFEIERELGPQIRLSPQMPIDEFVRHYSDDRDLDPAEYNCETPWSRMAIGADGRYTPCPYMRTGDMREQSIAEAWNSEAFRALRRRVRRDRIYPGCNGCCNLRYVGPKRFGLAGVETPAQSGA